MTEEVTYFKSAGLREIEFARIVKASLQLGKTAKSPQTSNPAPGWRVCGDLAHFAPNPEKESRKNCINTDRQKQKKVKKPWRIRTSHLGIERYGNGLRRPGYKPVSLWGTSRGALCGGRACASGVGNAGVAGLGALRGPMVFPTLPSGIATAMILAASS